MGVYDEDYDIDVEDRVTLLDSVIIVPQALVNDDMLLMTVTDVSSDLISEKLTATSSQSLCNVF